MDRTMLWGQWFRANLPASGSRYSDLRGNVSTLPPSIANGNVVPVPFAGTLSRFFAMTITAQPALGALVITLNINGVDSALAVTIPAGAPSGMYSNLTDSVPVNAGDLLSLHIQNLDTGSTSANLGGFSFALA